MRYLELRKLREKLHFGVEDLREILKVKPQSARVLCIRYAKNGLFVRLKRNFYILSEKWESLQQQDFLKIANFLQVPSYVSFMAGLYIYELTTQVQRNFWESAALKRSNKTNVRGVVFNYYKMKKEYYFDFVKKDGIFIASKEKAFIDALYLYSLGKYKLDFNSLDLEKLDKAKLKAILKPFPQKTKSLAKKLCRI